MRKGLQVAAFALWGVLVFSGIGWYNYCHPEYTNKALTGKTIQETSDRTIYTFYAEDESMCEVKASVFYHIEKGTLVKARWHK